MYRLTDCTRANLLYLLHPLGDSLPIRNPPQARCAGASQYLAINLWNWSLRDRKFPIHYEQAFECAVSPNLHRKSTNVFIMLKFLAA